MTGVTRRSGSSNGQFEKHIPNDVAPYLQGKGFLCHMDDDDAGRPIYASATFGRRLRLSLMTSDAAAIVRRSAAITNHLEKVFDAARNAPQSLTHKQAVGLSGEIYRLFISKFESNPGSADNWAALKGFNRAAREGRAMPMPALRHDELLLSREQAAVFGPDFTDAINQYPAGVVPEAEALEQRFGWYADWVLASHALTIDAESRVRLLRRVDAASTDAALRLKGNAQGDYSPDKVAERFPPVEVARKPLPNATLAFTYTSLFDDYIRQPGKRGTRAPRTVADYRKTFTVDFAAFIKKRNNHDDPSRITKPDVLAWRDHLLDEKLAPKTVRDKKLAAVKAVFGRAYRDGKLPLNPAEIEVPVAHRTRGRERGFTDDEAAAILRAAKAFKAGRHTPGTTAAIGWTPWLGAYTGARIAEITQLRGTDICKTGDGWFLRITPEAGGTKTGNYRDVPVHSHLIELGFLDFVEERGNGPLFIDGGETPEENKRQAGSMAQKVSKWVRTVVQNSKVQPTHGWRHRFATLARRHDLSEEARCYIQGHALPGMAGTYGNMAGLHREIEKLPRYVLGE